MKGGGTSILVTAASILMGKSVLRHLVVSSIESIVLEVLNLFACRKRSLFGLSNHSSIIRFFSCSLASNFSRAASSKG